MREHILTGLSLAALASILGVTAAAMSSCGIGLALGTGTWCSPAIWFIGSFFAMAAALIGGLPMWFLFRRLGLERHWQYVLGGMLCALPLWYALAQPFDSARWQHAGGLDSLNYLGSGAFGGFFFWLLSKRSVAQVRPAHGREVSPASNKLVAVILSPRDLPRLVELNEEERVACRIQLDGKTFSGTGAGGWLGFYDWLRTSEGKIIGVRQYVDDRSIFPFSRTFQGVKTHAGFEVCVFFGQSREFDETVSCDQDFGDNYLLTAGDEIALTFNAPAKN